MLCSIRPDNFFGVVNEYTTNSTASGILRHNNRFGDRYTCPPCHVFYVTLVDGSCTTIGYPVIADV